MRINLIKTNRLFTDWKYVYKHKNTGDLYELIFSVDVNTTNTFYLNYRGWLELECLGFKLSEWEFVSKEKLATRPIKL